jgi:hypothetical protein
MILNQRKNYNLCLEIWGSCEVIMKITVFSVITLCSLVKLPMFQKGITYNLFEELLAFFLFQCNISEQLKYKDNRC